MAFTADQRASLRNYLGFSEVGHDLDPALEGAMNVIGSTGAAGVPGTPGETRAVAVLAKLAALDVKLDSAALENLDATEIGSIKVRGPEQLDALRDYGRALVQQLAILFEVRPRADYYAVDSAGCGGLLPLG